MFWIDVYKVFASDVEKQVGVEKDSLENLRKQIDEAQKQSGKLIKAQSRLSCWIFISFVSCLEKILIYINYEGILLFPSNFQCFH